MREGGKGRSPEEECVLQQHERHRGEWLTFIFVL